VTFDHAPINTITATTVAELAELVGLIEQDPDLNVVVFDSANAEFYLAHYDAEHDPGKTAALPAGPTGMHAWLDLLVRLSRTPWSASRRSDGAALPLGRSRPGTRDPARRRRSRRTARGAVRVRQPGDRRRAARRRGRPDRRSEFPPALADFFQMLGRPEQQARSARLEALGLNVDSDLERRLGQRVVEALPDA
jgi:hypothetical protein